MNGNDEIAIPQAAIPASAKEHLESFLVECMCFCCLLVSYSTSYSSFFGGWIASGGITSHLSVCMGWLDTSWYIYCILIIISNHLVSKSLSLHV